MACVGAGTGLGECFLTIGPDGEYQCYPSEGGHAEWAPRGEGSDETQLDLLKYLKIKYSGRNRISVERVVSGPGICNIYEFLAYKFPKRVDKETHRQFIMSDRRDASVIAKAALVPGTLCEEAMSIFASCYGAEAGVLALKFMPFAGLYLTGGVTGKARHFLEKDQAFMEAYMDKGRVSPLLQRVPLYVVKGADMGKRGAHLRAIYLLRYIDSDTQPDQVTETNIPLVAPRGLNRAKALGLGPSKS